MTTMRGLANIMLADAEIIETPAHFLERETVDYLDTNPRRCDTRSSLRGLNIERLQFARYQYQHGLISDWAPPADTPTVDHVQAWLKGARA